MKGAEALLRVYSVPRYDMSIVERPNRLVGSLGEQKIVIASLKM